MFLCFLKIFSFSIERSLSPVEEVKQECIKGWFYVLFSFLYFMHSFICINKMSLLIRQMNVYEGLSSKPIDFPFDEMKQLVQKVGYSMHLLAIKKVSAVSRPLFICFRYVIYGSKINSFQKCQCHLTNIYIGVKIVNYKVFISNYICF